MSELLAAIVTHNFWLGVGIASVYAVRPAQNGAGNQGDRSGSEAVYPGGLTPRRKWCIMEIQSNTSKALASLTTEQEKRFSELLLRSTFVL